MTRELANRLLLRTEELGVVLHDTILEKDPFYATSDLIKSAELMRSCQHNMIRSLQSLAGGVEDGTDLFDAARTTGSRRADSGFPLDSLLHAYRLGTEVLWAALLEEARTHAPQLLDDLLGSAAQVMQLIDLMSLAAADEYRLREMEIQNRDAERRQAILDSLLEGQGADPNVRAEASRVLRIPRSPRLVVVVVEHEGAGSPPFSPREALESFGFPSEWRLRSDHEVGLVLLGTSPVSRLVDRLHAVVPGRAGVSGVVDGLEEVLPARRMAELALTSVHDQEQERVVSFEQRLPQALLAATPLVTNRLRAHVFGGLLELDDDKRAVLLHTLDCWFRSNRSAAEVGEQLHCHRNTVLHRLTRIETLSGRQLTDSEDELLFRLALLAR